jgi:hypothetical protein
VKVLFDRKAPLGKFRVIADEWPNMTTKIFGGDFDTLAAAQKEAAEWNSYHNTRATVFDDEGVIIL